jgi:ABC-2 type transport system permease protein
MPLEAAVRTSALVRHNTVLLLREPGPLISRMVLPLVFVAALRPLYTAAQGEDAGTTQAVTGAVVIFSLLAMSVAGTSILTERIWHTWPRLRTTAAGAGELLAGKAIPVAAALLTQQAVILGFGMLVFGMPVASAGLLVLAVLAWAGTLLAMGAMLGVLARSVGELSAAYDVGGLLLSSMGGALVPLASLPHWIQVAAPASPGYWAITALRSALDGDTSRTWTAAAVLAGFTAIAGAITVLRIQRGWSRSAKL